MDFFTQFEGNLLIGIQHALNADWLTPIMKLITMFGEDGIFWIAVCLVLILFRRTRRLGVICAFSLGDASFPSGHSANSMGPAWAMFITTMPVKTAEGRSYDEVRCLGWKGEGVSPRTMHKFGIAAVVLAVLIGISRLYLGMHYPSDVVCGLLIGMIVATAVYRIILRIEDSHGMMDTWLPGKNKKEK